MPLFWDMVDDDTLKRLSTYQWLHHRQLLNDPRSNVKLVIVESHIEPVEEIDKLMRQTPRRGGKHDN